MEDSTSPTLGMNRRELLKRGAVVGGTLIWAAPTVQTIGMRAAFAAGTPQDGELISCVTLKFECTDLLGTTTCYYAKWEDDTNQWETSAGTCPDCDSLDLTGCTFVDGSEWFKDPEVCEPSGTNDDCIRFCLKDEHQASCDIVQVQVKNGDVADCKVEKGLSVDCYDAELDNPNQ